MDSNLNWAIISPAQTQPFILEPQTKGIQQQYLSDWKFDKNTYLLENNRAIDETYDQIRLRCLSYITNPLQQVGLNYQAHKDFVINVENIPVAMNAKSLLFMDENGEVSFPKLAIAVLVLILTLCLGSYSVFLWIFTMLVDFVQWILL